MSARLATVAGSLALAGALGVGLWTWASRDGRTSPPAVRSNANTAIERPATPTQVQELRERLHHELQPVRLENCTMTRFGEANDGGYLMCGNLLEVEAGYSYGINNYDGWGCRVATQLGVPVHQYDCFDTRVPPCATGETQFHPECVAGRAFTDSEGRRFDSVAAQLARNGHEGRRVVMKMDVEGAEWDSLLETPREVLERIDQLALEFHGVDKDTWKYYLVVTKLKDVFHIVHLHFNNHGCKPGLEPFPSYAYEVLLVNKRLGVPSADTSPVRRPHALDAPSNPELPDCQYVRDLPSDPGKARAAR